LTRPAWPSCSAGLNTRNAAGVANKNYYANTKDSARALCGQRLDLVDALN
jgi:hypothetical protein